MRVRGVLKHKGSTVETLDVSKPLAAAIERFGDSKIRALVITDGGRMVGILAIRDVLARIGARGAAAIEESVRESMTTEVVYVGPEDSLEDVHRTFLSAGINHLPVLAQGRLVGLVTPADVLGRHAEDLDHQRELLQAYITNALV